MCLGGISDKDVDVFCGFKIKFALTRYHEWHECADNWIELAVSRIAAIFIVVAPIVAGWCMAVVDDNLIGSRFGYLMTMKIRACENNIVFTEVESAHRFDCHGGEKLMVVS